MSPPPLFDTWIVRKGVSWPSEDLTEPGESRRERIIKVTHVTLFHMNTSTKTTPGRTLRQHRRLGRQLVNLLDVIRLHAQDPRPVLPDWRWNFVKGEAEQLAETLASILEPEGDEKDP
jgi:hypothetical protein